ncbi:ATP-binding protein [Actinomarinicola tropica]|nr:ATP-binding protein [Actinomarinicola tropica]
MSTDEMHRGTHAPPLPHGPNMHLRLRATINSVPVARHTLRDWLRELGSPPDVIDDLCLAITELVTNAIEASPTSAAEVSIQAVYSEPDIYLEVVDHGNGFSLDSDTFDEPGPQSIRGRGLPIVQALVDLVAVERRNGTTKVVATRRLAQ